jgi:hypothetical protein
VADSKIENGRPWQTMAVVHGANELVVPEAWMAIGDVMVGLEPPVASVPSPVSAAKGKTTHAHP